jgi:hypothetical protein
MYHYRSLQVHQSPQSSNETRDADFLFINFNVAFSAIVFTFIWKESCENKFGIEGSKDRQNTTDFLRDANFIGFPTTCFGLCRPSSGQ